MRKLETLKSITAPAVLSLLVLSGASYANTPDANTLSNYPAQAPLFTSTSSTPLNMLVMGRDHKLYFEAYNDASDLNGDGVLDIGYKGHLSATAGGIDYFGYFNSSLCYEYTGTGTAGYFKPVARTENKQCTDANQWSGDYLNYLTTSRMDALRKVLYGGYRDTDTNRVSATQPSQTILRGAYITQDAHTWGKEVSADSGFNVKNYAKITANLSTGRRHLFSVTSTADNGIPQLQVIENTTYRIWDWVSKERPVAGSVCGTNDASCGTITRYNIRVEVCPSSAALQDEAETECKTYPSGAIKPIGVLHDFGESDRMHFGLLTGSYKKNISGGVLRANIASFAREVDPSTGQFCTNTSACTNTAQLANPIRNGIVDNINKLRMTGFHFNTVPTGSLSNNNYSWTRCPWIPNREMNQDDECYMWGNPIGEMMYETLRYFAGASGPTGIYNYNATAPKPDIDLGLAKPDWVAPYSASNYPSCSVPAMTVISDINPSFDTKLPGSQWSSMSNDVTGLSGLNVSTETNAIGTAEGISGGKYYIGEAEGVSDGAPTSKTITNLAQVRGLAPEEPTRQGTYYSAGVARFAANNAIGGSRKLYTYAVALASPLPKVDFKIGDQNITVVPFAKTVGGGFGDYTIPRNSTASFRPTNSIADFYVESIANMEGAPTDSSINGGRPYMKFRINFEDQEQGADFDMDRLVTYTLKQTEDGKLNIELIPSYTEKTWIQNIGYVISGTQNQDGAYLELCTSTNEKCGKVAGNADEKSSSYILNTPPGKSPGYCATTPRPNDCFKLPMDRAERTFTPGSTEGAGLLENPLWYAAKYGIPGRDPSKIEGDPDNYFLVTNALNLKDQLNKAFSDLEQRNPSVSKPAIGREPQSNPTADTEQTDQFIYRTEFDVSNWTGQLIKEKMTNAGGRQRVWTANFPASRNIKMADALGTALEDFTWNNLEDRTFDGRSLWNELNRKLEETDDIEDSEDAYELGKARVQFIKGETCSAGACSNFRTRSSLLGDIVGSNPVLVKNAQYVNYIADSIDGEPGKYAAFKNRLKYGGANIHPRRAQIYVGANDGMLHAFDAETGEETFAFVPTAVIPNLNRLMHKDYTSANGEHHQYFVDGKLVTADVYFGGEWRTVLVGTLGAGGREVFALDVTDPDNVELLWEFTTDSLASKNCTHTVATENNAAPEPECEASDLGYSIPTPVIARLHDGNWGVVFGNGYNSPNEASGRATLFILNVADGSLIAKLDAQGDPEQTNGLSSPRLADNNSDGVADYAYAGDLQGNLWRFDLFNTNLSVAADSDRLKKIEEPSADAASQFQVSFGVRPLYTATTKDDGEDVARQAITAAPNLIRHPTREGYIVVFGTGIYLGLTDKTNFKRETLYGIWDRYTKGEVSYPNLKLDLNRSNLQQQSITNEHLKETFTSTVGEQIVSSGTWDVRLISQEDIVWQQTGAQGSSGKYGWYLDLAVNNADGTQRLEGERIVDDMIKVGEVLLFSTRIPSSDPCVSGVDGFLYAINPATGGRTRFSVFDLNNDGRFDSGDQKANTVVSGIRSSAGGFTITRDGSGRFKIITADGKETDFNAGPRAQGRQSWRMTAANPPSEQSGESDDSEASEPATGSED